MCKMDHKDWGMLVKIKKLRKKKKKHLRRGVTASIDQNFPTVLTTKVIFLIINRVAWKFYYSERDWYLQ